MILNLDFFKNINFFQNVKNLFRGNILKQHAQWLSCNSVKWLSLISVKSKQVSKIWFMVKCWSHPMHIGGSSPFSKKEWVIKEWPMCSQAITVSSFLFVRGQTIHSFSTGNIWCNLFSGNSSHSDCHSSNIYLFVPDFRSENGMSSTEMSPTRASLAPRGRNSGSEEALLLTIKGKKQW